MIRGYSSLVCSAGVSAPPGRYEDNPIQFIPLVSLSNHLKCTIESDSSWLHLLVGTCIDWGFLKVIKSGDPTVHARGISSRTTWRVLPMYWSACPLLVSR